MPFNKEYNINPYRFFILILKVNTIFFQKNFKIFFKNIGQNHLKFYKHVVKFMQYIKK